MNEKLKEKTREALTSVLPITVIVLMLSVTLVPMEVGTLALFLTGAVLLIVGASTLFGKILTFEEAPQRLASIVLGISDDPHLVLLMIIGVLYVLGMFMETLATIIILVPVLLPMILQLGIDPIHFGIVLVVTNNVAMLTPPLGVNLFVASRIAGISVERISVAVIPYLIALTLCLLLFTYVPAISTWLPSLMGYGQ